MQKTIELPYILDFMPLQDEKFTRISQFFKNLREGKLTTTKCKKCSEIFWHPRVVCPNCNSDDLEWIELPNEGELFAFTSMILGAPLGFEKDTPFVIGIVDLGKLKILSRIDNVKYEDCFIGMKLKLKIVNLEDGRVFYRFERK